MEKMEEERLAEEYYSDSEYDDVANTFTDGTNTYTI